MIDFRLGRYQDVLRDVMCDSVICDPPYSERTHSGQRYAGKDPRYTKDQTVINLASRGLPYAHWTVADIRECVSFWSPRCKGWFCAMTSHDLVNVWTKLLQRQGRYVFAPVPCIQMYMNVRLAGDGPANWTVYLVVARPTGFKDGAKQGAYIGQSHDKGENALDRSKRVVPGGKPIWMMSAIIRDYSQPGDLIADPTAGGATTLISAASQGRFAVGAEMNPDTYAKAGRDIAAGYSNEMFV